MKSSLKEKISILIVCILLGVILAIQFKTFESSNLNIVSNQRAQQIAIEYKKLKNEREKSLKEIEKLEEKVYQYEKGEATKDTFIDNLYKDIEKYKMLSGYKDVKGEGIVIQIEEPSAEQQLGVEKSVLVGNYSFLLEIISLLNAVEVEAISINDQRYTAYTEIVPAGNLLEVNGISISTPITIKVIGNPEDIENALRIKGGIIWLMEQGYNLQVDIKKEKNLSIHKYKRMKEFKYAKPDLINRESQ